MKSADDRIMTTITEKLIGSANIPFLWRAVQRAKAQFCASTASLTLTSRHRCSLNFPPFNDYKTRLWCMTTVIKLMMMMVAAMVVVTVYAVAIMQSADWSQKLRGVSSVGVQCRGNAVARRSRSSRQTSNVRCSRRLRLRWTHAL